LCGFVGALDDYTVPREWYAGLIARGRGNNEDARHAFEAARNAVLVEAEESPNDAKVLIMRALIDAMLGRAEEAISTGERAAQLLPVSADALDGPLIATNLAAIYAQLGRRNQALDALEKIVTQAGGPTPGTLRIEPQWDPLREEARFQKLIADVS
jgi:tetratricopeptide (TPR) repeat protein